MTRTTLPTGPSWASKTHTSKAEHERRARERRRRFALGDAPAAREPIDPEEVKERLLARTKK